MAKAKSSKSKIDIKQFLLERGDRVGLIVAGLGFALLVIMGALAASKAASPGTLSKGLKDGAAAIDTRLAATPDLHPPERKIPTEGATSFRLVKVTEFPTPNPLFNIAELINEKRVNPQILPPEAGQAVYAMGGVGVYVIQDNLIAIIVGRKPTVNNQGGVLRRRKSGFNPIEQPNLQTPAPPPAPSGGGGPPPKGGDSKGPGGTPPGQKIEEKDVEYKPIDSKEVETAALAINLRPERMAVVRAVVPYNKQVEKYLRALRIDNAAALVTARSEPTYAGFDVERLTLLADGKTIREPWRLFDLKDREIKELYRLAANLEEEEDRFRQFQPQDVHRLYLKRPRFEHGGYTIPAMDALLSALKEMQQSAPPRDLTNPNTRAGRLQGDNDPFDMQSSLANTPPPGGGGGGGGGMPKGGDGAPSPKGGGPAGSQAARNNTVPVWIMQFVDPTIEPGLCYRYRVRLRAVNPNFGRKDVVASPGLAEQPVLLSEWFEIPDMVTSPPEEFLYAGSEKHPPDNQFGTSSYDTTTLKYHRWYKYIRSRNSTNEEPIAEWVIADIEARRGQYVHQERKAKIPLWSMPAGNYILKHKLSGKQSKTMENVDIDLTPSTRTLLVDFQGGKGAYRGPTGSSITDECAVEVLLVADDGRVLVTTARSTVQDKELPDKKAREDSWEAWIKQVETNTPKP